MEIILINSKKHGAHKVFLDEEDFHLISGYNWYIAKRSKIFYAAANHQEDGIRSILYMHRLLMGFPNKHIDHKDGNGLNNQKYNLRMATKAQNLMNRGRNKNNTTGFKGVYRTNKSHGKPFRVVIMFNRKYISGGNFNDVISAAKKYNNLALSYFGEFAKLNPIPNEC